MSPILLFSQTPPPSCTDPFAPPALDPDDIPLWPYILAKTLIFLYTAICALSLVSLCRIVCQQHKLYSFRFFFLSLSLLWTLLRILFFLSSPSSTSCASSATLSDASRPSSPVYHFLIDLLYYLPSSCQLAMFSLLLLFYAKLYHQQLHTWKFVERRAVLLFALLNTAQLLVTVAFIVLIQQPTLRSASLEWYHQSYFILSASFFLTLFLVALYYFNLLHRHTPHISSLLSSHHLSLSTVIFLLLLSRCIFDGGAALDSSAILFRRQLYETNAGVLIELPTFLLLVLWEIVPTALVIVFFRDTPQLSSSSSSGAGGGGGGGGVGGGGLGLAGMVGALCPAWCGGWWRGVLPGWLSPAPLAAMRLGVGGGGTTVGAGGAGEGEDVGLYEDDEAVDAYYYDGIEDEGEEEVKRRREREEEDRRVEEERYKNLSVFSPYSASLFLQPRTDEQAHPLYAQTGYAQTGYAQAGYSSMAEAGVDKGGGHGAQGNGFG